MGGGEGRFCVYARTIKNLDSSIGSKGDKDPYLVERLGFTCYSCYLDGMVRYLVYYYYQS